MGLLGFQAAIKRDDPVMLGTLYMFTLLGLVLGLLGDRTCQSVATCIVFRNRGNRAWTGGWTRGSCSEIYRALSVGHGYWIRRHAG